LKGFPPGLVGDVASGTGFAGVVGHSALLGLQALGVKNQAIYFLATPTMIVYQAAYLWLAR